MPLEDIYIQEMDRATSKLEVVRINPTRGFMEVKLGPDGKWLGSPAFYTWQNGAWYDTGGNPMDAADVPQMCKDQIDANPVTVTTHSPAVTAVCRFCSEKMNSSEMEAHLIAHVNETMKQAGAIANPKGEPQVTAKNTHRPGA